MKFAFVILIALAISCQSFSLMDDVDEEVFNRKGNVQFMVDATIDGMNYLIAETISLEHNKIKAQYTTFSADYPAFDIVVDYTEGKMIQFFNLTGECKVYQAEKMCLTKYLKELFHNHTELAGHRGSFHSVYEIKHPEEKGSRSWLYTRKSFHNNDHKRVHPVQFQSHHPASKQDYTGYFVEGVTPAHVSNHTFSYPQCNGVEPQKLDFPVTLALTGVAPDVLAQIMKN